MPNYVSEPEFETLAPGVYAAVCIDVVNLGRVKSTYEGEERNPNKHRLIFQTEERDSRGNPFIVRRDYTSVLSPKANLTKTLESWRGKPFTAKEKKNFDLDVLVGVGCQLIIINAVSQANGKTYANIENVLPLPRGMKPPIRETYIRVQDRPSYKPPPPDPKSPAQIAKEAAEQQRRLADFLSEDDIPKSDPTPPAGTEEPVAVAAGDFVADDEDVPF